MSDNTLAYLPANGMPKLGTPAVAELGRTGLGATGFGVNVSGSTGFGSSRYGVTGLAATGFVPARAAVLAAKSSSQPKQGHRDLAADVMTIDARSWASRPRRMSLAR